jgi:hypothetical protein
MRCAAARGALAALVVSASPLGAQQVPSPADSATARRDSAPLVVVSTPLRVADAGPGASGRMLRQILAAPHVVLRGDTTRAVMLRRDTAFATSVIVLGGDVVVAAHVRGDVVALGGDVFLRPGARVEGRAIAWGGGVYPSTLGIVRGGLYSYRDHTFDATDRGSEITLAYRDLEGYPVPVVAWPLLGLQIPEYTRVDGLAIGIGPTITIAEGGVELVPTVTYRSNLGALDPRVEASVRLDRRTRLYGDVGRGTFSNDRWIRSNLLNSLTTLFAGVDTRNYFRADRADVRVERRWESATTTWAPFLGARVERAWSTGPESTTVHAPWTITEKHEREDGILRPNPTIARGRIASALAGGRVDWESPQGLVVSGALQVEQAFLGPTDAYDGFTQASAHVELGFPTFGSQSFDLTAHGVASAGDPPPQRWAYLGGNGTLLTLELLELGGDQLAYVESRYNVPIDRVKIPFVGPPILTFRHAIGSAGVRRLPDFVQNVGVRLTVAVIRFDYTIDPATREKSADVSFAMPFAF